MEQRTIRSPIDGVVTQLHRRIGEFVAPNNPDMMTVVELDPLLANFSALGPEAMRLRVGQKVKVYFPSYDQAVNGIVDFIAPVTDAESGTVPFKVRIDNPDGKFRSGEQCELRVKGKK